MCLPPATLMEPSGLTVSPWHPAQSVALAATPVWPPLAGGKPWQLPQVAGEPFQDQVATEPA